MPWGRLDPPELEFGLAGLGLAGLGLAGLGLAGLGLAGLGGWPGWGWPGWGWPGWGWPGWGWPGSDACPSGSRHHSRFMTQCSRIAWTVYSRLRHTNLVGLPSFLA